MPRLTSLIIADILHAAQRILAKLDHDGRRNLPFDEDLQSIVIHCFTVMGEAANHLDQDTRARFGQVNWTRAISFRNFIIHEYFRTNWSKVLAAAATLPEMVDELEKIQRQLLAEEAS